MKNLLLTKCIAICTMILSFPTESFAKITCKVNAAPTSDSDLYICGLRISFQKSKAMYVEKDLYLYLKANNLIDSRETGEGSETGVKPMARSLNDHAGNSQIEN